MSSTGDFIDDDDGMGYVEYGEEDDWGKADEKDEAEASPEPSTKKRKDEGGQAKGWATLLLICGIEVITFGDADELIETLILSRAILLELGKIRCCGSLRLVKFATGTQKKRSEPSRAEQQRAAQMFMLTSSTHFKF
jgi:FtsZ-interacting cell division protein YlmF